MISAVGTHIKVKDFKQSHDFYTSLGFNKVFEYGPDKAVKEDYNGAVFDHGGCKLEIADGHRAVKATVFGESVKSSKISLMINTDGLEDVLEKCKSNGIDIAVPVRHYYWNTLELVIKDPDGVVLVFIQTYDPLTAKKLNADESFATKP